MRERRVEAHLRDEVKKRGGWAIKILPSVSGLPDRMILLPGGWISFVETKSPTGTVAAHQTVVHGRFERLGFPIHVLGTLAAVDEWIKEVDASRSGTD